MQRLVVGAARPLLPLRAATAFMGLVVRRLPPLLLGGCCLRPTFAVTPAFSIFSTTPGRSSAQSCTFSCGTWSPPPQPGTSTSCTTRGWCTGTSRPLRRGRCSISPLTHGRQWCGRLRRHGWPCRRRALPPAPAAAASWRACSLGGGGTRRRWLPPRQRRGPRQRRRQRMPSGGDGRGGGGNGRCRRRGWPRRRRPAAAGTFLSSTTSSVAASAEGAVVATPPLGGGGGSSSPSPPTWSIRSHGRSCRRLLSAAACWSLRALAASWSSRTLHAAASCTTASLRTTRMPSPTRCSWWTARGRAPTATAS